MMTLNLTTIASLWMLALCFISANVNDQRLPRNVLPISYELTINPEFVDGKPEVVKGKVKILIEVFNNTNLIVLNSFEVEFRKKDLVLECSKKRVKIPLKSLAFDRFKQLVSLRFKKTLKLGRKYLLTIQFTAKVHSYRNIFPKGFIAFPEGSDDEYMLGTSLEPIGARQIMPCFDEVDMKAVFDVRIVRKADQFAVSNGRKFGSIIVGDTVTDYFERTPVMSTYLLCIIVGDLVFKEITTQNKPYKMRLVAPKKSEDKFKYVNEHQITPIINYMEQTTTIPYAMDKLDHAIVPGFAGAMENWGLITYAGSWFYDERTTYKLASAQVIAHEVAHQWYGNLVTCKWWYDTWLQEGFATYYEFEALSALGWDADGLQQLFTVQRIIEEKKNETPVRKNITSVLESGKHFDDFTYKKGAAIVRMIERVLTKKVFTSAMAHYLKKYQYSVASSDDLFEVLDEYAAKNGIKYPDGSPLNFSEFLVPWLNQKSYPLVKVKKSGKGKAIVSQTAHDGSGNRWDIPLRVTSHGENPVDYWFRRDQDEIEINIPEEGWFLVNPNQSFFYRVWYDEEQRRLQSKHLMEMSPASRAQIIDDSFKLFEENLYTVETVLDNLSHLDQEDYLVSWVATLENFRHITTILGISKNFLKKKAVVVLDRIGKVNKPGEPIETEYLRDELLSLSKYAYELDPGSPYTSAQDKLHKFNDLVQSRISNPMDLAKFGCEAVTEGSTDAFELVKKQYDLKRNSEDVDEKLAILYALGCSKEMEMLSSLFKDLINGSFVENSDVDYALSYISQNYGNQKILDYLRTHWHEKTRFHKTKYLQELVSEPLDINTIKKIQNIIEEYNISIGERSISKLNNQEKLIETNREILKDWLTKNNLHDSFQNEKFIPMSKRAFVPTRQDRYHFYI